MLKVLSQNKKKAGGRNRRMIIWEPSDKRRESALIIKNNPYHFYDKKFVLDLYIKVRWLLLRDLEQHRRSRTLPKNTERHE